MTADEIREAYRQGALDMQARIADGIDRWWAMAPAGHRHPGHPHHLAAKVRAIDVDSLPGPKDKETER